MFPALSIVLWNVVHMIYMTVDNKLYNPLQIDIGFAQPYPENARTATHLHSAKNYITNDLQVVPKYASSNTHISHTILVRNLTAKISANSIPVSLNLVNDILLDKNILMKSQIRI
jgi:hypothetical protein